MYIVIWVSKSLCTTVGLISSNLVNIFFTVALYLNEVMNFN